jgi:hypothetical protein
MSEKGKHQEKRTNYNGWRLGHEIEDYRHSDTPNPKPAVNRLFGLNQICHCSEL